MKLPIIAGAFCVMALALAPVSAQQKPVRVRGTIEAVNGPALTVKSRDGEMVTLKVADNVKVLAMVKASLSDIKPGSFVGATAMPEDGGRWKAVEVHIFLEAMRGTGEGDHAIDYRPKSTMTNGTVGAVANPSGPAVVAKEQGTALTLNYKDGEKTIEVMPGTVIYTYAAGSRDELKPGAIISAAATRQADGTLEAARVNVARGIVPPM